MGFRERLNKGYLILDGAMGTALQACGLALGECPERLNFTAPDTVRAVHKGYLDAGAEAVYANTFQANRLKLPRDLDVEKTIAKAIALAREAGAEFVGLDVGPSGALIEPAGELRFEEAYEIFAQEVRAGAKHGADFIALETFTSLYEMKAALLAAKECGGGLPVLCTMSFEANGRTVNGTAVGAMGLTLERLGADAIGFNCSVGAEEMIALTRELKKWTNLPLVVKANAGVPNGRTFSPEEFAACYRVLMREGVSVLGGCCGTDACYIAALNELKEQVPFKKREAVEIPPAVCSESCVVTLERARAVGERINPTGKKRMKEALRAREYGIIEREAAEETEHFAEILDVNCGIPEIDEEEVLPLLVKRVQAKSPCPLMLDVSSSAALEKALRVTNGVPLVNSVNADETSLKKVLPLVKRYGAAVVGLCLDEEGIPPSAKGRIEKGERILAALDEYGIEKERLFLDALTLSVATGEYSPKETLEAVREFTKRGIGTVLGVSNISFGLPNRETINAFFLGAALEAGLKLAIVNPSSALMMDAISAYRLLHAQPDVRGGISGDYAASQTNAGVGRAEGAGEEERGLVRAVIKGLKEESAALTEEMLLTVSPEEVIEGSLIKGLDRVGALYEKGKLFLPELIAAAEAAKAAFGVIEKRLPAGMERKGKVLLATVRGDIHDIGKNIVKAVMENYGYEVIDLGKDVPKERIVAAALHDKEIALVGLSALMTTTAASMKEAIEALKAAGYRGKIMVGGAVITEEFAKKIGADYYAKDANASVRIAEEVYGQGEKKKA